MKERERNKMERAQAGDGKREMVMYMRVDSSLRVCVINWDQVSSPVSGQ